MIKAYEINFEVSPPRFTLVESHDVDAYMDEMTYHEYDTLKANGFVDISNTNTIIVLFNPEHQSEAKEVVRNIIKNRATALKTRTEMKLTEYREMYHSLR